MATAETGDSQGLALLRSRFPDWGKMLLGWREPTPSVTPNHIAKLIEGDVIPRLIAAHRPEDRAFDICVESSSRIADRDVAEFAELVIDSDAADLLVKVEGLILGGATPETILLELFTPTARELGRMWENDDCDFVDVTMGLWRLQELSHDLAGRMPVRPNGGAARRGLIAVFPSEQHVFGAMIVAEFLRNAGWSISTEMEACNDTLVADVRGTSFDLIGITVSQNDHLESAKALIADMRRASRNPHVVVMVGGRVFAERPELADYAGADGTAFDAGGAVEKAELLVKARLAARLHS